MPKIPIRFSTSLLPQDFQETGETEVIDDLSILDLGPDGRDRALAPERNEREILREDLLKLVQAPGAFLGRASGILQNPIDAALSRWKIFPLGIRESLDVDIPLGAAGIGTSAFGDQEMRERARCPQTARESSCCA